MESKLTLRGSSVNNIVFEHKKKQFGKVNKDINSANKDYYNTAGAVKIHPLPVANSYDVISDSRIKEFFKSGDDNVFSSAYFLNALNDSRLSRSEKLVVKAIVLSTSAVEGGLNRWIADGSTIEWGNVAICSPDPLPGFTKFQDYYITFVVTSPGGIAGFNKDIVNDCVSRGFKKNGRRCDYIPKSGDKVIFQPYAFCVEYPEFTEKVGSKIMIKTEYIHPQSLRTTNREWGRFLAANAYKSHMVNVNDGGIYLAAYYNAAFNQPKLATLLTGMSHEGRSFFDWPDNRMIRSKQGAYDGPFAWKNRFIETKKILKEVFI